MEKSAKTISRAKFANLSDRARHRLFVTLVEEATDPDDFFHHYARLQTWVASDHYHPPSWLTPQEALQETRRFHLELSGDAAQRHQVPRDEPPLPWSPTKQVTVVLDQVRSPYNVGSVLRLIDNFGLAALHHGDAHLNLDHPQLRKAARGCERWIPVHYEPDLLTFLENQPHVIGLELEDRAISLKNWRPPDEPFTLILGNETYGIAQAIRQRCQTLVAIPLHGNKGSMNLSHALAVAAHHINH